MNAFLVRCCRVVVIPLVLGAIFSPGSAAAQSPLVNMSDVARTIAARTHDFVCARVVLQPNSATAATLRGWVGSQADLDTLSAVLRALPTAAQVTSVVSVRPWPQCEALLIASDAVSFGHDMVLATMDHEGTDYQAGSRLILKLRTPDFPSYLYVAYLPASGAAVWLYQPLGFVPQALPPRTIVNLGGGDDPRTFKIGPPFGVETVIAIAAASPLFTDGQPASATARDYLAALRRTLLYKPDPSQPNRLVDAKVLALTTRDRAP